MLNIQEITTVNENRELRLPKHFFERVDNNYLEAVVVTRDAQTVGLVVWSLERWNEQIQQLECEQASRTKANGMKDKVIIAYKRCVVDSAQQVKVDSQGKIPIPEELMRYAGFKQGDDIRILGNESSVVLVNVNQEI